MKTDVKIRLILALSALLLASGCAVVQPATPTEADEAAAYIYNVENGAFGRATRIIWVNPPKSKREDSED